MTFLHEVQICQAFHLETRDCMQQFHQSTILNQFEITLI